MLAYMYIYFTYRHSYGFSSSHVCKWPWRRLSDKELMLLNYGAGEDSWEFLGLSRSNQSILKEINPDIHWKDWCWSWSSNTLATWRRVEALEKSVRLGKRGQEEKGVTEDEMVGWHHWLNEHEFEQTQRQWRIRKPGILQSMAFARVKCNLATEQWL